MKHLTVHTQRKEKINYVPVRSNMSPSILEDSYISLYPNNSKQKKSDYVPNNPAPDGPFKTLESNPTSAIDLERTKTAPSSIKSRYH